MNSWPQEVFSSSSWEDVSMGTSLAAPRVSCRERKHSAGFLLLSYSSFLWLKMSQKPNWDQVLQGFRNIWVLWLPLHFSNLNFLRRFFHPSVFICLGETGDLCDSNHWFLPERNPFLSPSSISSAVEPSLCSHCRCLSWFVFLKNVAFLISGYKRTQNLV